MSFMCLEKVLLTYIWQHAFKHWKRKLIEVKTEIQNLIVLDLCLPSHQLSQLCWAGADFIGDLLWKRHRLLLLLNLGWWRRRSHSRLYAQTRGLELPDFTTSCNLPKMHQVEKESGNLAGHLFFKKTKMQSKCITWRVWDLSRSPVAEMPMFKASVTSSSKTMESKTRTISKSCRNRRPQNMWGNRLQGL